MNTSTPDPQHFAIGPNAAAAILGAFFLLAMVAAIMAFTDWMNKVYPLTPQEEPETFSMEQITAESFESDRAERPAFATIPVMGRSLSGIDYDAQRANFRNN